MNIMQLNTILHAMQIHVIGFRYYKLPKKCKNGKNG